MCETSVNNIVSNNTTSSTGGGLVVLGYYNSYGNHIQDNQFSNNTVSGTSGYGGGIAFICFGNENSNYPQNTLNNNFTDVSHKIHFTEREIVKR